MATGSMDTSSQVLSERTLESASLARRLIPKYSLPGGWRRRSGETRPQPCRSASQTRPVSRLSVVHVYLVLRHRAAVLLSLLPQRALLCGCLSHLTTCWWPRLPAVPRLVPLAVQASTCESPAALVLPASSTAKCSLWPMLATVAAFWPRPPRLARLVLARTVTVLPARPACGPV